jgi:hypothetical protein
MTREEAQEFVERWRKAGPELEKIRREELRALTDAEGQKLFGSLLEFASLHPQKRATSGLVEQQRIFQKARQ